MWHHNYKQAAFPFPSEDVYRDVTQMDSEQVETNSGRIALMEEYNALILQMNELFGEAIPIAEKLGHISLRGRLSELEMEMASLRMKGI